MWIDSIDEKDNQIVSLLREDGRMSYSHIGKKVGLSRTAVKNRVAVLEKAGIICGYHALVRLQDAPRATTFLVNMETEPGHFEEAREALVKEEQVITVVQTTGHCHLLAVCVASNHQNLRDFLNRIYKEVPGIQSIHAHTVIDVAKGSLLPDNTLIEVRANDKKRTGPESGQEKSERNQNQDTGLWI